MQGKRGWGEAAESYAIALLKKNGYKILEKNFRNKFGEIDVIALDGDTLIFVEVKARSSRKFGLPQEAVGVRKLYKIKRVGQFYLMTHPNSPTKQRIDVVALEVLNGRVKSAKIIKVV
jgi:putative endonuclease